MKSWLDSKVIPDWIIILSVAGGLAVLFTALPHFVQAFGLLPASVLDAVVRIGVSLIIISLGSVATFCVVIWGLAIAWLIRTSKWWLRRQQQTE